MKKRFFYFAESYNVHCFRSVTTYDAECPDYECTAPDLIPEKTWLVIAVLGGTAVVAVLALLIFAGLIKGTAATAKKARG